MLVCRPVVKHSLINLNTSQYDTLSYDLVYKNNNGNKYYLYNIYTNELNIITSDEKKIYEMVNNIILYNM